MDDNFKQQALKFHEFPQAGKLEIKATKPLQNQRDLSLAYSPGVAIACQEIIDDHNNAFKYTSRANLVGVISNGSAVLGLGNIGALASKPVMEGKAVLFKKFANVNVFDIEINEQDPQRFIEIVKSLEPTFGGINLEDIKAPECFIIEEELKKRCKIPIFHDDQHGTAITVATAIINALRVVEKDLADIKIVTSGAGAAALACLNLLVSMGANKANITITDIDGVVYKGREQMNPYIENYAQETDKRALAEVITDADLFLGLSAPRVLKPEYLTKMAPRPIIMALANPVPEIMPELAKEARPDAIIATGRSDFPNQVNNVLCFPYIFRGALDVGATEINEAMKIACVYAMADLAMAEPSDIVAQAYGNQEKLVFGADYLIPKPFDPRLMIELPLATAKAAIKTGVATRPIEDFVAYRQQLSHHVFSSGLVMKPIFDVACTQPKRVILAEGEEDIIIRAAQAIIDENVAKPILIGNPDIIEQKIANLGLKLSIGDDIEVRDMLDNPYFDDHWQMYHHLLERKGISPSYAQGVVRSRPTVYGALMLKQGQADGMIVGSVGRYHRHLAHINDVIGSHDTVKGFSSMNVLVSDKGTYFICDTAVHNNPTAEEVKDITLLAAKKVKQFGVEPKVALLSTSNFGTFNHQDAVKMQQALRLIHDEAPDLEVEGEMQMETALDSKVRGRLFPNSLLVGEANLFIMPNLDAATISFDFAKHMIDGQNIGPILLGSRLPVHIITPSMKVRDILNMAAICSVDAGI